ncbi:efflux RND transporter periplasmic adaptor subunit [uncultured Rhodoblastus sp.]|uniref:efflux RND transporter periplasmic adaptor subunit n=1 Tax=uncultured Rhodoblastus sp. TaxID=543037 RepID=UPI0025E5A659|nr:efflux RND transporter periplasmic adaptor subunit [uncultured Rhodoblastus sp.]
MNDTEIALNARQALGGAPEKLEAPDSGAETRPSRLPPPSQKPWRWLALLVAVAAAYWGWRHFRTPSAEPAATPYAQDQSGGRRGRGGDHAVIQPVGVAAAERRDVNVVINALGTVTPIATVTVVSQISGYLQQVGFTEGQHVKKGDFLAQIDPRPYEALKAQYEGQLAHDQGLLDQARVNDVRYQALLKQNSIARQTAEDQKYVIQQYEGTVRADQALVNAQALNIAYAHIVSPVDGRVGLRLVDPGNYVQAGSTAGIAVVTQLQPMSVLFSVPEDALNKIAPKMRDGGQLTAVAYDRANVRKLATGVVTVLDNQVDTTTGMVKLRATFDNADEALFPNQFVNIRLLVEVLKGVVAVPTAAVQHGAPGDYTYVVTNDGKAAVRVLKIGQIDGDRVQILSGIDAGDRVVVDGADRLREGAEVRVVGDASTDAASPANAAPAQPLDPAQAGAATAPADPAQDQSRRRRRQGNADGQNGPSK